MSGAVLLLAGCAIFERDDAERSRQRIHSVLAAGRARQISFFGDVGTDHETNYFTGAAVSLKRHTFTEVGADTDPALDSDGRCTVFSSTRHSLRPDLYIKSVDGVAVTQLTSDPASDVQPTFRPDDARVAFASDRSGNWDIWVVHLNGGQPIQITDGLADELHPSWSPDGTKLVYCSRPAQGGPWELWITDAHGGSMKKFIGYGLFPQWSPVGDRLLFQRARERGGGMFSIWTLTLVDGEPRYPTEIASSPSQALILPAWSRDGGRIAFTSIQETVGNDPPKPSRHRQQLDIWMISANGNGKVRLTDGHSVNFGPAFSPDGRLFFTTNRSGHENIWSLVPVGAGFPEAPDDRFTGDPRGVSPMIESSGFRTLAPRSSEGLWDVRNSVVSHASTSEN